MQSLCTLRNHCRQWSRNTRYQAGAAPYLGRTSTGWIAPACGWRTYSITSSARASNGEAKRLRGFEVDHKLILGRRLNRQVGRLSPFEDAINVAGAGSILVRYIGPIGDQPAVGDKIAENVNGRQTVPGGQCHDQLTMERCRDTRGYNQAAIRFTREFAQGAFDLGPITYVN